MNEKTLYCQVGQRVREHRKAIEITQDELAQHVGLERTSLTNIESGNQRVQLHTLYAIGNRLGCSLSDLLPDEFQPEDLRKRYLENKIVVTENEIVLLKDELAIYISELANLEESEGD